MKKKVKKEESVEEVVKEVCTDCKECPKIDKLTVTFPNVDSNKLVEKINEIIDKLNDSI